MGRVGGGGILYLIEINLTSQPGDFLDRGPNKEGGRRKKREVIRTFTVFSQLTFLRLAAFRYLSTIL